MGFGKDTVNFLNGFRKLSTMFTIITIASVFRVTDYISGSEFVSLVRDTAVVFLGANSLEHMTSTIKDWIKTKATSVKENING